MKLWEIGTSVDKIQTGGKVCVITDRNVAKLYLKDCVMSLEEAGFRVYELIVEGGETSKSGEVYLSILEFLAENEFSRTDGIVALGGGVVGDLAGFAAATYMRGIKVYQVPTTLLAAVDSSVGGKTAINLKAGKNLAGAFHLPALVLQDSSLLKTLPEDVFLDGMAEVIKYGVIWDDNLFELLKDPDYVRKNIDDLIDRCVRTKEYFVEEDLMDTGTRQILNFGHTIGHAVELVSDFEISHGKAVAIGMVQRGRVAASMGICSWDTADQIEKMVKMYGFDTEIPFDKDQLIRVMKNDKKRKGNYVDIVVPERIGKCRLERISADELGELL